MHAPRQTEMPPPHTHTHSVCHTAGSCCPLPPWMYTHLLAQRAAPVATCKQQQNNISQQAPQQASQQDRSASDMYASEIRKSFWKRVSGVLKAGVSEVQRVIPPNPFQKGSARKGGVSEGLQKPASGKWFFKKAVFAVLTSACTGSCCPLTACQ